MSGSELMAKLCFVHCKVSLGFFETEFYVVVDDSAAFVDRASVRVRKAPAKDSQVEGQVLAAVIREQRDRALVELPGQPVVGTLRTWVPKTALAAC
jgi:hypothetical protein